MAGGPTVYSLLIGLVLAFVSTPTANQDHTVTKVLCLSSCIYF